jgi:hypothetical protein
LNERLPLSLAFTLFSGQSTTSFLFFYPGPVIITQFTEQVYNGDDNNQEADERASRSGQEWHQEKIDHIEDDTGNDQID